MKKVPQHFLSNDQILKKNDFLLKDFFLLKRFSDKTSLSYQERVLKAKEQLQLYQANLLRSFSLANHLPISTYAIKIAEFLKKEQVLLIQGTTGSGKSTQVPKILINEGLSQYAMVGMTQPRRLAAKMIAQRISEEILDTTHTLVGWQVRHESSLHKANHLKVMTDGILLQEILKDPLLLSYQVIIIDEIHERSVNTDLLLGLMKIALSKRKDLKLILLSAAFEIDSLSAYFENAPVLKIPGKLYPIEENFLPENLENVDQFEKFSWALKEAKSLKGDILVFLPTEYHIYQYKSFLERTEKSFLVLPLFSRLPKNEIQKVFQPSSKRRIILSTNIAETSLTIDNIAIVIDQGFQKISLYDPHLKMTTYPIVPISKVQQVQRRGRCGRTGPGHCFYLYTQIQQQQLSASLLPAIERTSTDQLVLQLLSLGQKKLKTFPFYQSPKAQSLKESLNVLTLLKLCDNDGHLTALGKKVRYSPMEPRLALMLERSKEYGSLSETVVIVAFFMGQDPRLFPQEALEKARMRHKAFADLQSDFVTLLNLYSAFETLSHKELKNFAQNNFLSVLHLSFWKKNVKFLRKLHHVKEQKFTINHDEKSFYSLHRALSFGLVDKIFYKTPEGFKGPRNVLATIDKRSCVKDKSSPTWVMAFILEKRKDLTINFLAPLEPHFILPFLQDSLKIVKKPPFLCQKTGFVYQSEDHLLWGLPLRLGKRTLLSSNDLNLAREVFIKSFFSSNLWEEYLIDWVATYKKAALLSCAARDSNILKRSDQLQDWALTSWPQEVCSIASLKQYYRMLTAPTVEQCFRYRPLWTEQDFPNILFIQDKKVAIEYLYDHREEHDGTTLLIPETLFLSYSSASWIALVPGLRLGLINYLLENLPKKIKPDREIRDALARELTDIYDFPERFDTWITEQCQVFISPVISYQDFSFSSVPSYLLPFVLIEDSEGSIEQIGRLSFQLCLLGQERQANSLNEEEDLFERIFQSAKSQAYFLPNFVEKKVQYLGKNPYSWRILLKSQIVSYLFEQLTLKKRIACYEMSTAYRDSEDFLKQIVGSFLTQNLNQVCQDDLNFFVQFLEKERWSSFSTALFEHKATAVKLNHYREQKIISWSSSYLSLADRALRESLFLPGLPDIFLNRVSFWIELLSQMKVKQHEKFSLLQRFDADFTLALQELEISYFFEENSLLIAFYLEWAISVFLQPIKPMRPFSYKKFIQWAKETNNFLSL